MSAQGYETSSSSTTTTTSTPMVSHHMQMIGLWVLVVVALVVAAIAMALAIMYKPIGGQRTTVSAAFTGPYTASVDIGLSRLRGDVVVITFAGNTGTGAAATQFSAAAGTIPPAYVPAADKSYPFLVQTHAGDAFGRLDINTDVRIYRSIVSMTYLFLCFDREVS